MLTREQVEEIRLDIEDPHRHAVKGQLLVLCKDWLRLDEENARLRRPIPSSGPCYRCGRRDGLDAAVTDEQWQQISGRSDGGGLLCLWCMDELAVELSLEHIPVRLYFAGGALFSVPVDEFGDLGWSDEARALLRKEEDDD